MKRDPKSKEIPHYRQPTHQKDPESFDKRHIRFRFDLLDFDHHLWGWNHLNQEQFISVFKFLQSLEKLTWAEIKLAAGGRNKGTNHHPLNISEFHKRAKDRINELNLSRVVGDTLFSFRLQQCTRIYGMRDESDCRIIWHDPYHCDPNQAAYPIKQ